MTLIEHPQEMRQWTFARRAEGGTVGFVPTMGALHEGHLSLVRASVEQNEYTVVSIFVNPAQFAPHEDFDKYPRTFEADSAYCESLGADVIYVPRKPDMYPDGYATYVNVEGLDQGLCSLSRPHFFRGVATVVTKLFNAVPCDRAYFGQKDAQQCAIITRMCRDLDFGIEIVEMPIVREADGLAMSSRNVYLSPEERQRGLCLSRSLRAAKAMLEAGERDSKVLEDALRKGMAEVDIDYIAIVSAETMIPLERVEGHVLIAVASQVGATRLIDNIKYRVPAEMNPAGNAPKVGSVHV